MPPHDLPKDAALANDSENQLTPNETNAKKQDSLKDETGPTRSAPSGRIYKVRRGDTLEGIALRFYGTRSAARKVFEANRNRLKNQHTIREGMTIVIP